MNINLDRFSPRSYQLPIFDAIENKGYKRVMAILPRRAGKDIAAWNLCIRQCLRKVCTIYYILPTYSQAKKVIWDSITISGERFLDYIPKELVESIHSQEMKIRFKNGSLLQLVGSENYDRLMGVNFHGAVLSEYSLQDPQAWLYIKPILAASDGWALFLFTPRGRNHAFDMYEIARESPHWFCYKLSIEDTQHIPMSEIDKERESGEMSEAMIQQEYYCSFELGTSGFIYAKYMDQLRLRGAIDRIPWDISHKVHTAWDIGLDDKTVIIFFQNINNTIRIIDLYDQDGVGLEHYVKVLKDKPYIYGKHIAPHDIKVRDWAQGAITRLDKARQLGINFTVAPHVSIEDGIEAVRTIFPRMFINEYECRMLIKALDNYRYDSRDKNSNKPTKPLHDWSSDYADALRYLAVSLSTLRDGVSAQEIENRYRKAMYGDDSDMPAIFRNT